MSFKFFYHVSINCHFISIFRNYISLNSLDKDYEIACNNFYCYSSFRVSSDRAQKRRQASLSSAIVRDASPPFDSSIAVRGTCVWSCPFAPRFLISRWSRSSIATRRRAPERRGSNVRQREATKKPLPKSLTTIMPATPRRGYASARRHSRWCLVAVQLDQL